MTLSPTALAVTSIRRLESCDVVVLCPYMTDAERELLLDTCAGLDDPPAVVEVSDRLGAGGPSVRIVSLPDRVDASAQTVVSALIPAHA